MNLTDSRTDIKRVTNEDLLAAIKNSDDDADRGRLPSEARISVDPGTKRYKTLCIVFEDGPLDADAVADRLGKRASGVLTRLHDAFVIDRTADGRFEINDLGRDALNGGNQTLDDIDDDQPDADPDPDPWDDTPLNRGQYTVLQAIADASEHPKTTDIVDAYADAGFEASSSAVSARLKSLFDDGMVDRTPARPYRYWVTDDGDDLLSD
jgi:hypothetical protein